VAKTHSVTKTDIYWKQLAVHLHRKYKNGNTEHHFSIFTIFQTAKPAMQVTLSKSNENCNFSKKTSQRVIPINYILILVLVISNKS